MPPVPQSGMARVAAGERAARVRFRRAITLMVMTLVLPGSAQLVAGHRPLGRAAIRVWAALWAVFGFLLLLGYLWHGLIFTLVSSTLALGSVQMVLTLVALGWAGLLIDAWRLGRPLSLLRNQRLLMTGLNGALVFSVAGAVLFSAHLVSVQRDFVATMFTGSERSDASNGRYNVLLLGADSGDGRMGLRPDSLNVASIDAKTGRTVIFGLPRNLQNFPFADGSVMADHFPDGWNCDDCYLNAVSTWAEDRPQLFDTENPGVEATMQAVEGITGLDINYWAIVNMQGFRRLVDAVGGVTLTLRDPIPVGGLGRDVTHYLEPGTRKLNGHDTLWFARAREGSDDYSRMARQKCVMHAMVGQISPQRVVRNFDKIASASVAMFETNLPSGELDTFIDLALKARNHPIGSVSFTPPQINTRNPDLAKVRQMVDNAIARAEGRALAKPKPAESSGAAGSSGTTGAADTPGPNPNETTGGSKGSLRHGYQANEADDLADAC
ncbi:LCP family protein [Nocardioides limicola]|uniref:LCP family protein n=1 Tax=Nocardioides limicola TaxID=2803368 RepID=UPI00193BAFC3|nr:LCP family protein [Nocardioides sp. DJM-14]